MENAASRFTQYSLDQWVSFFSATYREANRGRPPSILWLEAIDEATKLGEEARKDRPTQVLKRVATLFGWICAFAGKYILEPPSGDEDPIGDLLTRQYPATDGVNDAELLAKWVWRKFPGRCPVCAGERCVCPSYRKLAEDRHVFSLSGARAKLASPYTTPLEQEFLLRNIKQHEEYLRLRKVWQQVVHEARWNTAGLDSFLGKSLDRQIEMFVDIYGGSQFDLSLLQITAKLLEETGEAGREIVALTELWSAQNRLRNGEMGPDERRRLEHSLKESLNANRDNLPVYFCGALGAVLKDDLVQALEYFRLESANSLRGELADVFSWLTAVHYKVATGLCEYRGNKEWPHFSAALFEHYTGKDDSFRCPGCDGPVCDKQCLLENICLNILQDKVKEHRKEQVETWDGEDYGNAGNQSGCCGVGY